MGVLDNMERLDGTLPQNEKSIVYNPNVHSTLILYSFKALHPTVQDIQR